jgi:hypothetical protein
MSLHYGIDTSATAEIQALALMLSINFSKQQ